MPISIWSNQGKTGEYKDETFYESNSILIVKYFGQRKGGRDHLLEEGAFFFIKDDKLEFNDAKKLLSLLRDTFSPLNLAKSAVQNIISPV